MSATSHAILNASSASRWMSCPGSIREIARLPDSERNQTSLYADEGTAAHTLAECCLRKSDPAKAYLYEKISADLQDWEATEEMVDAVQVYLDEVAYHMNRLNGNLSIERHVQPLDRDDTGGTADVIIYEPFGELVVIDFKYGKGVVVQVDYNDQMMYYGLGALREVGFDDVSKVTLVIVQPRAPHEDGSVRRWVIQKEVLREFGDHLESAAVATQDPEAPLNAGPHCRFCPVTATCPAMRQLTLYAAKDDFADLPADLEEQKAHVRLPDLNDPEELGRAMQLVPLLDFWAREVEGLVYRRLECGAEVPGYKLVRGRSNRKWEDAEDVERRLRGMKGIRVDDIFTRKLCSPAQIEKIKAIGKKWVAKYAIKPEGKLTVAPERNAREAVEAPLLTDFASPPPENS